MLAADIRAMQDAPRSAGAIERAAMPELAVDDRNRSRRTDHKFFVGVRATGVANVIAKQTRKLMTSRNDSCRAIFQSELIDTNQSIHEVKGFAADARVAPVRMQILVSFAGQRIAA